MKTVMQQLLEELNGNSFQELFSNQNYIKDYLENRIKSIYLEAEKEQIIEAYNKGVKDFVRWDPERHGIQHPTPEEYFNKTFKSDE